jgi:hypothetical protein
LETLSVLALRISVFVRLAVVVTAVTAPYTVLALEYAGSTSSVAGFTLVPNMFLIVLMSVSLVANLLVKEE